MILTSERLFAYLQVEEKEDEFLEIGIIIINTYKGWQRAVCESVLCGLWSSPVQNIFPESMEAIKKV